MATNTFTDIHNFRDLGGIPTESGKVVRSGQIFRSATTHAASAADVDVLKNDLGILNIVDLRGPRKGNTKPETDNAIDRVYSDGDEDDKKDASGNKSLSRERFHIINKTVHKGVRDFVGIVRLGVVLFVFYFGMMVLTIGKLCTRLHVPFGNYICSCAQQLQAVVMKAILDKPGSRMEDLYYIILTRNATEVEKALKFVATESNQPLIFHCTSGKDRTGLVSALLLSSLGVSRERVIEEYHTSHVFALSDVHVRGILKIEHLPDYMLQDEYIQMVVGAPKTSLERCLDTVEAEYGSLNAYLDSIGCGEGWRRRLREKMLVDK